MGKLLVNLIRELTKALRVVKQVRRTVRNEAEVVAYVLKAWAAMIFNAVREHRRED